jgi:hypothetical protein
MPKLIATSMEGITKMKQNVEKHNVNSNVQRKSLVNP